MKGVRKQANANLQYPDFCSRGGDQIGFILSQSSSFSPWRGGQIRTKGHVRVARASLGRPLPLV